MSTPCDLCGFEGPSSSRNFGLELCAACETGQLQGRLHGWGAECVTEEFILNDDPEPYLRIHASVTGTQPLLATFERKTAKHSLKRLFSSKIKTGDPLFDNAVIASSKTPALLQQLLENDGFQSAVMSLTTHCDVVEVQGSSLKTRGQLTDFDLRAELPLAAAALLRHLARLG